MKKMLIITIVIVGLFVTYSFAHMQGSMMSQETMMESQTGQGKAGKTNLQYMPCGHMTGSMMGSGMMMGGGMMTGGGMMGHGMMGTEYKEDLTPFTKEQIEIILKSRILYARNPNLKVGKVTEKNDYFEAEIVTKGNSLVNKLKVDKYTGWAHSAY